MMRTFFGAPETLAPASGYPTEAVVAIGNFDGVHLGHQSILKKAQEYGKNRGLPVVVLTFNPHPTLELRPQSPMKLLMTYVEKRIQLEKLGADFCVEQPFNVDFAALTAREFFDEILMKALHSRVIIVGQDFAFGRKREGNTELLKQYCEQAGVVLDLAEPVMLDGKVVSSSLVREALSTGSLDEAAKLLGRPFFYRGEVVHGDKRGRTIGFPTANMKCEEKFPLLPGVYATSVFWRGQSHPSVTNIGKRPTFQQENELSLIPLKIETHILDQTFDLYGEVLEVCFHHRIRDERRFSSVDELKAQIASDVNLAKKLLQ
jgi:riboflavin kinase/FMN adenylyltransferase